MNQVYSHRHRIVSGPDGLRGQGNQGNCGAFYKTRRQRDSNAFHGLLIPGTLSPFDKILKGAFNQRHIDFRSFSKFLGENEKYSKRVLYVLYKTQFSSKQIFANPQDDDFVLGDAQIGAANFFRNIMDVWKLKNEDMAILLGNDQPDSYEEYIENLLEGRFSFEGRDVKDRMAQIFQIRRVLCGLFQDDEVENEWLRESHELLDDQAPMDLMLEGSMENLSLAREFVEIAAGL